MKILISRKDIKDTRSGVPKNVLRQTELLSSRGHDIFVIAERINKEIVILAGGMPVKTIRWPLSGYFRRKFYQYRTAAWIKKHKPGLVISHGDIETCDVVSMHNCTHLAHERIFSESLPIYDDVGRIHKEILSNGRFKLLLCNSRLMKNDFIDRFGVNPNKIEVIYPEINTNDFYSDNPQAVCNEMKTLCRVPDGKTVIGLITSGNFRKRNVTSLINAFAGLSAEFPDIFLFIAGADDSMAYSMLSEKLGISEKVMFAPSLTDVKRYYYMIDIFVLPAFIEEFGRSVLEAMYCKKPVVVSKYVGAAEILEGVSRNFILERNDADEIAEKLALLLKSNELVEKTAAVNYESSLKYSSGTMLEQFYLTLVRRGLLKD